MGSKHDQVVALIRAGVTVNNIVNSTGVSRRTVFRVKQRLRDDIPVQGPPRKARERGKRTPAFVKRLQTAIVKAPTKSIRKHAQALKVSERTVRRAVTEDLGGRSMVRRHVPLISEKARKAREDRSRALLTALKHSNAGHIIFFSDEKNFCVDPVRNRQNDRFIRLGGPGSEGDVPTASRFITKTKHPASLMFLGVVASTGEVSPPIWFPKGFRLTALEYQAVLKKTLVPWMKGVASKYNKPFVFQQDGAPAHTAHTTQRFLEESNIKFWSKTMWPPSSPDLNPLDYAVWGQVEEMACSKRHENVTELKKSVNKAWRNMSKEFLVTVCSRFRSKLEKCVAAKGGLIEC